MLRYGPAEHFIVQVDFMLQPSLNPRREFSIPGASKSASGHTGYADVVSLAKSKIWEIKPDKDQALAAKEAADYVEKALKFCDASPWTVGTGYFSREHPAPIWTVANEKLKAELFAEQRGPGVIAYYWKVNNKPRALTQDESYMIRTAAFDEYFPAKIGRHTPNYWRAPNDVPPPEWSDAIISPNHVLSVLGGRETTLLEGVTTNCGKQIPAGSVMTVLFPAPHVDRMQSSARHEQMFNLIRVHSDPTRELQRSLYPLIMLLSVAFAGSAVAVWYGLPFVVAAAWEIGTIVLIRLTAKIGAALVNLELLEPLLARFVVGLRGIALPSGMSAASSVLLIASSASGDTTNGLPPKVVQYEWVKPRDAINSQLMQKRSIGGEEWVVVAIATPSQG